jgi:hypothetical protein
MLSGQTACTDPKMYEKATEDVTSSFLFSHCPLSEAGNGGARATCYSASLAHLILPGLGGQAPSRPLHDAPQRPEEKCHSVLAPHDPTV